MAKDNTNNNSFALLSLVAIVAVVGVISLVMMTNTSGSAQMDSQTQMSENLAGEAVFQSTVRHGNEHYCTYGGNGFSCTTSEPCIETPSGGHGPICVDSETCDATLLDIGESCSSGTFPADSMQPVLPLAKISLRR